MSVRAPLALALALAAGCARPPEPRPQSPTVPREEPRELAVPTIRFVVRTNPVEGTLYLTGGFNDWQPGERRFAFERSVEQPSGVVWTLDVERARLGPTPIEFKFTRGSWQSVETDGVFDDVPNHVLSARQVEDWPPQALMVLDFRVPAFSDQRKAAERPRPTPSVVGRLVSFELESELLANTRLVRVWLPPDYDARAADGRRYPVLYLQDGQNLFDASTSFGGVEWQVDEALSRGIEARLLPPLVVVGIDHAGLARAPEYNPPETRFPGGPGRGERYVEFLERELLPAVEARYRVAREGSGRAIGGSSFGANIALYAAMRAPELFGALLLESPSVGYQDNVLLELAHECGTWPARVSLGVGTAELPDPERASAYLAAARELEQLFTDAGLGPDRLCVVVDEGAGHDEAAWARRLPAALEFLFPLE